MQLISLFKLCISFPARCPSSVPRRGSRTRSCAATASAKCPGFLITVTRRQSLTYCGKQQRPVDAQQHSGIWSCPRYTSPPPLKRVPVFKGRSQRSAVDLWDSFKNKDKSES